jgi:hypothetical protein
MEARRGAALTPEQIFEVARARETALSRLLMLYITTGVVFMLLPGTFLGVWNLIAITSRHAADSISRPWIQAHGHAQIFGWVGCFILGIGFHSLPKLRRQGPFALWVAWACWTLWTAGVALRWTADVYLWHWRLLLPASAALELAAFALFFHAVSGHKPERSANDGSAGVPPSARARRPTFEPWVTIVIGATLGLLLTLLLNLGGALYLAGRGADPAFPPAFDLRFLALSTWGFLVPFVWGFSAKWMPVFLGLKPLRPRLLQITFALNSAAVLAALAGLIRTATVAFLATALLAPLALRLFARPQQAAKTRGVHASFPVFVRLAYLWLIVAAALGIWASRLDNAAGVWGASRHALTVGFVALMIFCVGQRILPAFSGMRLLFSPRLMFLALALLTLGCALRVSSELLAYQGYALGAWRWLPVSAVTELAAVTLFAINLLATFASKPATSS